MSKSIGTLRNYVRLFESLNETARRSGFKPKQWREFAECWAEVILGGGSEPTAGDAMRSVTKGTVRLRAFGDTGPRKPTDRDAMLWRGTYYFITDVGDADDGRGLYWLLKVSSEANQ